MMTEQYTTEFLISELHRFYNEVGHIPTSKDFDSYVPYELHDRIYHRRNKGMDEMNMAAFDWFRTRCD